MEPKKFVDILSNINEKPNKDLFMVLSELEDEFEKTKKLIIDLTEHMDTVEQLYNKVNEEIDKRKIRI